MVHASKQPVAEAQLTKESSELVDFFSHVKGGKGDRAWDRSCLGGNMQGAPRHRQFELCIKNKRSTFVLGKFYFTR